jgi:hypothetical protein
MWEGVKFCTVIGLLKVGFLLFIEELLFIDELQVVGLLWRSLKILHNLKM